MKKGFTLIELLAVIVILAIIALIATPIVLNIINDSKESSRLRSADFYLDGVEYSVAQATLHNKKIQDKTYNILNNGNICLEYKENECINELKVEVNGEKPTGGTITIKNGAIYGVSLILNEKEIIRNIKGEVIYGIKLNEACELEDGEANQVGAKYSCDFGSGKRNFYILEVGINPITNSTLKTDEVALILEGDYDTITQTWCDQKGPYPKDNKCNGDGLIEKLDEIASAWSKLSRTQIGIPSAQQLMVADGKDENEYLNYSTLTNDWLYVFPGDIGQSIGYWTSTIDTTNSEEVWHLWYDGMMGKEWVYFDAMGVRPVINIKA